MFDRFPAAVDITYYGNMLAAGANARAIRGYEFASDRYLAGRDLPDHMLDIASEVTARLVRICKAGVESSILFVSTTSRAQSDGRAGPIPR